MNNSVIISSIKPRIDYYLTSAGITNDVEKNEYKKKFINLEKNFTHPQLLDIKRGLESFNLAMGEKRTTEKMYLERDIKYLTDMENSLFPMDKNSGRNFVNTMKQNNEFDNNNELNDSGVIMTGKTLTKVNNNSGAYKFYSDAA